MLGPDTVLAGRYRLRDLIGSGGMGEVWRATDQVLRRTVAVKLLRPELLAEPGFAERFQAEAHTLATIRHRGVVTIHDYVSDHASAFLVMECIDGESLASLLRRETRFDPATTMALVAEAADALQAAHDRGVIHRDIKPANLLVDADGSLVLTDFGIARTVDALSLTLPGMVIGTPAYISPEQVRGDPATVTSDIYSLGVVGYECLTGQRPLTSEQSFDIALRRAYARPLSTTGAVPAPVAEVIDRALAYEPGERWPSAAEMARRARQAAHATGGGPAGEGPTTLHRFIAGRAAPPPPPARPTRFDHQPYSYAAAYGPPPAASASPPPPPPAYPPAPTGPEAGPPATVTVAGVLFLVAAASTLLFTVVTLSILSRGLAAVEQLAGESWASAGGLVGLVALMPMFLTGLGYLMVAVKTFRGRPGTRTWAFVQAVPLLCCCLPGWLAVDGGDALEDEETRAFAHHVMGALPNWFEPFAGATIVGGALSLLVALVLVLLPPAGRHFRPKPLVIYYPYQPPPR
jgi:eukaryotic-like serine/threonine-protein kinase